MAKSVHRRKNSKQIWTGVVILLLCIAIGYWFFNGMSFMSKTDKMQAYLKEKYGKDFVVKNYRVEGSGLGVEGDPVADAQPVDDPTLRFLVRDRGKSTFADTYAQLYWSKQGQEQLGIEVKNILTDVKMITFSVTGGLDQNFFTMQNYPFTGSIPNIKEVLKTSSDKLDTKLGVQSSTLSSGPEPSTAELARALKLMLFARDLGIQKGTISYTYTSPAFKKTDSQQNVYPRYIIAVDASNLDNLQQPEQLEIYFKDNEREG